MVEYKAEMEDITGEQVPERDTSKPCSRCGRKRKANCCERGLYVCDERGPVTNADVNDTAPILREIIRASGRTAEGPSTG